MDGVELLMELRDALESRHSIRSFTSDPVPRKLLEEVLSAAALAPSPFNEQPWRFYVASGESRVRVGEIMTQNTSYFDEFMTLVGMEPTEEHLRWYTEMGGAPVVVACTMPKVDDKFALLQKQLTMGAAIENILLAATEAGLGTCGITSGYWVRDLIGEALGVPEDRTIIAMIVMGYPSDEQPVAPPHNFDIAEFRD